MHISIHRYLQIYRERGPTTATLIHARERETHAEKKKQNEREKEREEKVGGCRERERARKREDLQPATLIDVAGGIIADAMPMRNTMCEVALVCFIRSRPPHISECVM